MRRVVIVVLLGLIGVSVLLYFSPRLLTASPTQPIAFSHKMHSGERQIPCTYCHRFAAESTAAGIPSVELCVGCHNVVSPTNPEVQKVLAYASRREPIPWVRVYRVPDFVYFSHQMHIAASLGCDACHKDVAAMARIPKPESLTMGWCLDCHRARGADTDCWTCHE